ncbi:MAG TPA: hypothetical protein VL354_08570, partial [Spirochaetia bacterium]|nr:hypothetical protein [Spirochaetia bacterium]
MRAILLGMRVKTVIAALLLAVVPALGFAFSLSISELDVNAGLLFIGTSQGAPSPITQSIGVSMPLKIGGPYFVEPS